MFAGPAEVDAALGIHCSWDWDFVYRPCEHWRWRYQSLKLFQHLSNEFVLFLAKVQYSLNENPWFIFLNYSWGGFKLTSCYCLWSHWWNKQKGNKMPSKQQLMENTDLCLVVAVECACPSLMQPQNALALQVAVCQLPFKALANLLRGLVNNCFLNCACTCFLFFWDKQFYLKKALTKAKVALPAWPTDIKEITFPWCLYNESSSCYHGNSQFMKEEVLRRLNITTNRSDCSQDKRLMFKIC